jgi:acyl carrier protein
MSVEARAAEIRQVARELVAEILEVDPEEVDDHVDFAAEFEADSLQRLELMSGLEYHFGVRYPADDWRELTTVANIVARTLDRMK